jgi:hypothetical protein
VGRSESFYSSLIYRREEMRKAIVAPLLSGFVFPGLGQIYLKMYLRGLIIMILVTAGLVVMIGIASFDAMEALQALLIRDGDVDMGTVVRMAMQSSLSDRFYFKAALFSVIVCWVFSIVDAYIIGKRNLAHTGKTDASAVA